MLVLKFGGTSVGSADAFSQVAHIVAQARTRDPQVVVVTSAMSGVTNTLIAAAQAAAGGQEEGYREARVALLVKHQVVAGQLVADGVERAALGRLFDERLRSFERLCRSIAVLGELTNRGLDVVSGLGERLAAPLLAAVLRSQGVHAEAIDATEVLVTDNSFGAASPLLAETRMHCQERLRPLLEGGVVPVLTGFIGATAQGIPTTLGRGGSDYSAAIFGAVLDADEVQIWTDVNGVLTADPRIVPEARTLPELSYSEAAELSYFGAKVLHPKTILPAIERGIRLRVLNTFNPEHPGTCIVKELTETGRKLGAVKAITAIKNLTLVNVAGKGMMGVPGIAARTFAAVARAGANVLMISQSSSEQSITFVVPQSDAPTVLDDLRHDLARELAQHWVDAVTGRDDIVIVAVVGAEMAGTPGIAARVFGALGEAHVNVIAIAQGSSEVNISLVVLVGDADTAVRRIHAAFALDKLGENL
ncbi:aspartate kinase [Candidatus Amarolinea dominans]|uniref:aspartate kinase n=1 Tax=Candidatus Amarolinea dominans TaxID=3140696 RepID=UPI0031374B0D|nr:aspartate kinase [Anaerolineae bacterium]MBK9230021.1 aspartate kinase [Anaerolineae bacterium]